MRTAIVGVCALVLVGWARAQEQLETIYITGMGTPVEQALIQKFKISKLFEVVGPKDDCKVAVLISCMERKPSDPFVCMYVSHFNGPSFKSFMGGGLNFGKNADDVASGFLISISQDILERFDDTSTKNLREALEACLLLTDTKCNVPDPLQKELNAKQLTLGQYLIKKHQ